MQIKTPKKVNRADIFHIQFYEKTWFHGSLRGMCYRIEKITGEDDEKQLCVTTWPGPYNFDHTDDSLKDTALFEFSDRGLDEVTEYLNRHHAEHYQLRT